MFNASKVPARSPYQTNLKVLRQTGRTSVIYDRPRLALLPGKRISRTGKIYFESRKNRSDAPGSRV